VIALSEDRIPSKMQSPHLFSVGTTLRRRFRCSQPRQHRLQCSLRKRSIRTAHFSARLERIIDRHERLGGECDSKLDLRMPSAGSDDHACAITEDPRFGIALFTVILSTCQSRQRSSLREDLWISGESVVGVAAAKSTVA
jgi:hypothetical protein